MQHFDSLVQLKGRVSRLLAGLASQVVDRHVSAVWRVCTLMHQKVAPVFRLDPTWLNPSATTPDPAPPRDVPEATLCADATLPMDALVAFRHNARGRGWRRASGSLVASIVRPRRHIRSQKVST